MNTCTVEGVQKRPNTRQRQRQILHIESLIDPMPCKIERNGLVRIVANLTVALLSAIHCPESRVGHRVLFRSVRSVLFLS